MKLQICIKSKAVAERGEREVYFANKYTQTHYRNTFPFTVEKCTHGSSSSLQSLIKLLEFLLLVCKMSTYNVYFSVRVFFCFNQSSKRF